MAMFGIFFFTTTSSNLHFDVQHHHIGPHKLAYSFDSERSKRRDSTALWFCVVFDQGLLGYS